MFRYVLKRLILLIPTWLAISLIAFGLSKLAPGDPVLLYNQGTFLSGGLSGPGADRDYREIAGFLGLDKPVFYFSILSSAHPDTLYRIVRSDRRKALRKLLQHTGNWEAVQDFHRHLLSLRTLPLPEDSMGQELYTGWWIDLDRLIREYRPEEITERLSFWTDKVSSRSTTEPLAHGIRLADSMWVSMNSHRNLARLYLPKLAWHGLDNQYHQWLIGFFMGDMGRSYVDGREVDNKIWDAMRWTLLLNGLALLLAVAGSIWIGVLLAQRQGSRLDTWLNMILFAAFAIPSFWLATACLVLFTGPEYGMDWFPTLGPTYFRGPQESFFSAVGRLAYHFFLPVCCLSIGAVAYLSRQVRGSMIRSLASGFVLFARARGISERTVVWKHALRNSLFPLITILAGLFPALLAGSVVIEVIFNLYGMGLLTVQSILARDWPVVFGILQLGALLTILGILIADIAYTLVDPRVDLQNPKIAT